jgi:hypothetical protein
MNKLTLNYESAEYQLTIKRLPVLPLLARKGLNRLQLILNAYRNESITDRKAHEDIYSLYATRLISAEQWYHAIKLINYQYFCQLQLAQ